MASLRDRIRRLEGARVAPATPLSEAKWRQFRELFALIENARAELYGEPPPNVIEAPRSPSEAQEEIADGWKTYDWLREEWTRAGGGRLTVEEEEFLSDMRKELTSTTPQR